MAPCRHGSLDMGTISGIRHSPVRSPCPLAEGNGRPHTHHSHKSSGGGKWAVCGERFRMFDATTWSMHRVHATRGRPAQATMPRNSNIAWGTSNIHASQAAAAPSMFLLSLLLVLLTARRKMDADVHGGTHSGPCAKPRSCGGG